MVHVAADGKVLRALASSGRTNTQPWEVDPSELQVKDGKLTGALTVIVRDDQYGDMHFDRARAQMRKAGDGSPLALRYELTVPSSGNGTFEGTVGVAWETTGEVEGSWRDPFAAK